MLMDAVIIAVFFVAVIAILSAIAAVGCTIWLFKISLRRKRNTIDFESLAKAGVHVMMVILAVVTLLYVASLIAYVTVQPGCKDTLRREALLEGKAELLLGQLSHRFHPLPDEIPGRVRGADPSTIGIWANRVLDAKSVEEVFLECDVTRKDNRAD